METAHRLLAGFPAGVWLADLSPVRAAGAVAAEVGRLVGVTPGSGDPVGLIIEQLRERAVLLVVDNCEHVVDEVAALVHRLVSGCPRVRVLATSREPLGLGAEVTVHLPPLEIDEAVRLFIDRARAADPDFAAGAADRDVLTALCGRLDGLPLAVELAAPWIRMCSAAELLARLTDRFTVLAAARRDLPPRQRTMRATVEWSYQLLSEPQRLLFRRLAVFNGTFELDAAARVAGAAPLAPERVAGLLAGLRERSMVVVDRPPSGVSRYRLLETLKDFATQLLRHSGEAMALAGRHFAYYLGRAEGLDGQRLRTGSDAGVMDLVPDGDNYRTALSWAIEHDVPGALRLAGALEGFWMVRSVAEGRDWVRRALDRVPEPNRYRARALMVAPLVVAGGIGWPRSRALVGESIDIYERLGDGAGTALAELMMGLAAFFHGELGEARRHVELARRSDHPLVRARAATYLGAIRSFTPHRLENGRHWLRQGAAASEAISDRWGQGTALTVLGLADLRAGYRDQARQHLRQALQTTMQAGVTATAVGGLGALDIDSDPRRALTLLQAAVAMRERAGVATFPVHIAAQLDRARDAACRRLAATVADQCRARARAITTEEVLAYALADTEPAPTRLTARQQEVAVLVAEGLSNREIAQRLQLSVRTVETHVNNILTGLGLRGRTRLAGWVRDAGR